MSKKLNLFSGSIELLTADVDTHIAEVDRGFREEKNRDKHHKLTQRVNLLKDEVESALLKVGGLLSAQFQELNEALEELEKLSCLLQKPWTSKC